MRDGIGNLLSSPTSQEKTTVSAPGAAPTLKQRPRQAPIRALTASISVLTHFFHFIRGVSCLYKRRVDNKAYSCDKDERSDQKLKQGNISVPQPKKTIGPDQRHTPLRGRITPYDQSVYGSRSLFRSALWGKRKLLLRQAADSEKQSKNTITPARLSAFVNPKNPIVLMNSSFLSALRHNTDYFLIGLSHSIFFRDGPH